MKECTDHYHSERNQRLDNELIEKRSDALDMDRAVVCRERLGGTLDDYHRRAAWTVGRVLAENGVHRILRSKVER
jgi:hypothetical protein